MKLKKDPIGVDTLEEYLTNASDFEFELRILQTLTEKGIPCEHGGQYKDPDTKKFREFDLRARHTIGAVTIALAVECKAIGHHFPLLVSCASRERDEAYHQLFIHEKEQAQARNVLAPLVTPLMETKEAIEVTESSLYPVGSPVGKSTAQVGRRDNRDGELHANDAEFFEKWSQALQSLHDLVAEVSDREFIELRWNGKAHVALALPVVVVPDGTLWSINYAENGQRQGSPAQTDRVSVFIGRSYYTGFPGASFDASHLEVMTETGFAEFCDNFLLDEHAVRQLLIPTPAGEAC